MYNVLEVIVANGRLKPDPVVAARLMAEAR